METLPIYIDNRTLVEGKHIFHRIFWAFQPCIRGFAYCKPILQIDGTWLYGKYKETLLMAVAQDGNSNIFMFLLPLWKVRWLEVGGSFYRTWEGMLLLNLTYVWFQTGMHWLKGNTIIQIMVGIILHLCMSIIPDTLCKISCEKSRTETSKKKLLTWVSICLFAKIIS